MHELRWNPLLDTWTMIATNRQKRPHLPEDYCPFCPGSKNVPEKFDVLVYPNDFPVLERNPAKIKKQNSKIYRNAEAAGRCEVILYSSDHDKQFYLLSDEQVFKIVFTWVIRCLKLGEDKRIKYIYPFENRGEEVGVTIHHPHGQLYAYPFVPHKIETELKNCKNYFRKNGSNLFTDLNRAEKKYKKRVVCENDRFIAYIPYFTDYPFGVFIVSKSRIGNLSEFKIDDAYFLAKMLKKVTAGFDKIYNRHFPYMMCIHQTPVNEKKYSDAGKYYTFHIEFYPPLRAKDKLKWYAGSEMGVGAATNTLDIDECAALLRSKIQ